MESEDTRAKIPNTIEAPAPTAWPMITALGLTLAFAGLVTSPVVSAVGMVLVIAGAVGWFGEVFPQQHRETGRGKARPRWRLRRCGGRSLNWRSASRAIARFCPWRFIPTRPESKAGLRAAS